MRIKRSSTAILVAMVVLTLMPVSLVRAEDIGLKPISGSNCDPTTFEYRGHTIAEGFAVSISADLPLSDHTTQIKFGGAVAGLGDPWEEGTTYGSEYVPYVKEMWVNVAGDDHYTAQEDAIFDNTGTGGSSCDLFQAVLTGISWAFTAWEIYDWLAKIYQQPPDAEWVPDGHWSKAIVRQKTQPGVNPPGVRYVNPDKPRLQTACANIMPAWFEEDSSRILTITAQAEIYVQQWTWYNNYIEHHYIGTYSVSFKVVVSKVDVAVTSVTPSPTFVRVGDPVTITAVVVNQGDFSETFDVTAYYVEPITTPTPEQWDTFWSMGDVREDGYIDQTDLSLIWDHIGTSDPQYDINKSGEVTVGDYMICGTNQGKNIWTYFGTPHFIGKQTVSNLAAGGSTTLTFTWNTAGVPPTSSLPKPYTIKAVADTVPGEIDIGDNTYVDGAVGVYWVHDVAVTSVTPSPTSVRVGDPVTITVKAENQGDYAETFSVTTYYGSTAIGPTQTVTNLAARSSTTLTFTWNTAGRSPGTYTIKAIATTVQGETDTADNTCTDGTVTVEYHDVAIGNIDPWPIRLNIGYSVRISVYTWNQGNYNETFSVTTYYGSTAIGTPQTVTNLAPGSYKGLLFTWDTTGMSGSQAGTYTIKAVATTVAGETDTADNTGVDGVVTVKVPGDANFDRHVDMTDFYIWREYFGKSQWPPEVDPDFDNNGYVEMPDYYIWANNFGLW